MSDEAKEGPRDKGALGGHLGAAGPVGQEASETNIRFNVGILSYRRSQLFAGIPPKAPS
jgi:hypothetical protein